MLRLLKWAVLAVLVFVIAISILSRFAQARSDGRTDVFVLSAKSVKFLGMLPSRDSHCSLADVWTHGLDVESDAALKRVESSLRVLKLENGFDLIGTPRATFWIPHRDFGSLRDMIADQERDLYGAGSRGVHHGDIVLDCGANVGVYTRQALESGASLVVAIEPSPENLECLRRNFAQEITARRVLVYPKGVWDKDAVLPLRTDSALSSMANTVVLGGDRTEAQVPLTTIDKLVSELALPRVDMIKMDIEGAEHQALAGALQTVARFRPRLAVTVEHFPDDLEKIPQRLKTQWPGITVEYGSCEHVINPKTDRIQPTVVFGRW